MGDWLGGGDYFLLKLLNVDLASRAGDIFSLWITSLNKDPLFLAAVLGLTVGWAYYRYSWHFAKPLLITCAAVALADAAAYRGIKSWVDRPRPIHNLEISQWLRPVGDAHGASFPSNHATNMFAAAFILSAFFPRGRYYFYTFAALVALSRVTLGVHYPSDILGGAVLGTVIAAFVTWVTRKRASLWNMNSSSISG